jgi:phosphopantothenoylcysteine decarboxylase/phosphopantothenate--cysteine ligase
MTFGSLVGAGAHADLWAQPMAHIDLARGLHAVLVAPATADLMARMAHGLADDLATTALLAVPGGVPVWAAPAMNPAMWAHPATQANVALLKGRGVRLVGPDDGATACGEAGLGRMAEPEVITAAVLGRGPLAGRRAVVTSGPTWEAVDPVRVLANRSSGMQGHAVARALAAAGAQVVLVTGPVALADPPGVAEVRRVESAQQMLGAVLDALPADIFVGAAAVADWAPEARADKVHKAEGPPSLRFTQTLDIVAAVAGAQPRPALVVAFAAETDAQALLPRAAQKRAAKGADWVVANLVGPGVGIGAARNAVTLMDGRDAESWPEMDKHDVAQRLADKAARFLKDSAA